MKTNSALSEVDQLLLKLLKGRPYSSHCQGDDGHNRIGLRVPTVRQSYKEFASARKTLPEQELAFWDHIWRDSFYMESMSFALYAFQHRSLVRKELKLLIRWVDRIQCWEHSDDLSKILAQVVEENPDWILPTYDRWNKAKNPWKRRQSLVGLIEYHGKRRVILSFEKYLSYILPLLGDEDYYVQKAVGWTLREVYCLYPKQTLKFYRENLLSIRPTAYSAAMEKLDAKTKASFRLKRKEARQKA